MNGFVLLVLVNDILRLGFCSKRSVGSVLVGSDWILDSNSALDWVTAQPEHKRLSHGCSMFTNACKH